MLPPTEQLKTMSPAAVTERLLAEPEGQWFDRKSARIAARELARSLVAMANAEGGLIAIGLRDGACEGVDSHQQAQNAWRQAGLDYTEPAVHFRATLVECVNAAGAADHLFLVTVQPGAGVHATTADEVYLRVGDENRKLTFERRLQLRYDRGDTTFELTPARTFGAVALDQDRSAEYADRIGHPDPQRLLHARGLVSERGELLTAGQLLFGTDVQRGYPQAYVRVLRFSGTDQRWGAEQNLVRDVRCDGPLPQQVDRAQDVVREVIPQRRALGPDGRFDWFGIVPEVVWQEALVNAVVHRAYSNFGDHIRIAVFDDRIEVSSPGRFPGVSSPLDLSDLTKVHRFARNPRIARVMAEMAYGQELGEGLRRMVAEMQSIGRRPPSLRESSQGVEMTLWGAAIAPDHAAAMAPLAQQLRSYIERAGQLRTGELVQLSGVSAPTVRKYLYGLQAAHLVRRVARHDRDPSAYWVIDSPS